MAVAGRSPQPALSGFGLLLGGGNLVGSRSGVTAVDVGPSRARTGGLDRIVPAVGPVQVGQGPVNCSWMIHVVRLCRLNLSAGAFSLHAD